MLLLRVQRGAATRSWSPSRKGPTGERVLLCALPWKVGLHRDPGPWAGPSGASSAPTSQPLPRPLSCKVSRVWLRGVSRACSGLVSGLVGWQTARHLVTRHSVPAEPWVSRLITSCNTARAPPAAARGLPPPPASELGLTRAGGLPTRTEPTHADPAQKHGAS